MNATDPHCDNIIKWMVNICIYDILKIFKNV